MSYELTGLIDYFKLEHQKKYQKALILTDNGCIDKVGESSLKNGTINITGIIKKNGIPQEKPTISLTISSEGMNFNVSCSCYESPPCTHNIALAIKAHELSDPVKAIERKNQLEQKTASSWLNELTTLIQKEQNNIQLETTYEFHFCLTTGNPTHAQLYVEPQLIRRLKSGKLGSSKRFDLNRLDYDQSYMLPGEQELLEKIAFLEETYASGYHHRYNAKIPIKGSIGEELLPALIATGKCHFGECNDASLLVIGAPRPLSIEWKPNKEQSQNVHIKIPGKKPLIVLTSKAWYYEKSSNQMGLLETPLAPTVIQHFLKAPSIPEAVSSQAIRMGFENPSLGQLLNLNHNLPDDAIKLKPTPQLHLFMHSHEEEVWNNRRFVTEHIPYPMARLEFQYKDQLVGWKNTALVLHSERDGHQEKIARDLAFEQSCAHQLLQASLTPLKETKFKSLIEHDEHALSFINTDPFEFYVKHISTLINQGWNIIVDEDYAYKVVMADSAESAWFADIEPDEQSDWFDLALGVEVDGQKINLLPFIKKFLSGIGNKNDIQQLKEQTIFVPTESGTALALPGERIYHIVNSLIELYDQQSLTSDDFLRLSKNQAARLMEIQKATGAANLRWFGGERLIELGKRISEFKSIKAVQPPVHFKGELRAYQQEGLDWLQFLREYELNGILADDMGLGKTVQTLAHILTEYESGRMTSPTLVIAPTSLMYNWQKEASLFAPELKVCVLYGQNRHQYFEQLQDYHLILTTYPLILRDKEALLKHSFHLLILDEAHHIKNSKAISTQIVMQIKAKHRLCLTGTPMENHLGELWSLFHFVMPGFLGNEAFFKRTFRTPIEKHADNERRMALNRRIAPFLLRRTKEVVAKELPPKTEMIRYIELQDSQRDLYESIRVAMEEKVRKEIEKLGLARSHIVILDALLKLRQVCCDPRLLKIDSPIKQRASSAKIELLKEMLPELIEEGRRILIFSSFREMLVIIEELLHTLKIPYTQLTGQTVDRPKAIEQFTSGDVPVFLISLKAGGVGLNLTSADTVIHVDPWWNPAAEHQATDRAYRIGQDKPVFVYKLVTKDTVEEKIIAMQAKKQSLADSIYSDKAMADAKITESDLKMLFSPIS